jgi:hypothetical protein
MENRIEGERKGRERYGIVIYHTIPYQIIDF